LPKTLRSLLKKKSNNLKQHADSAGGVSLQHSFLYIRNGAALVSISAVIGVIYALAFEHNAMMLETEDAQEGVTDIGAQ
jgi:hypothetical protein